jgi:hypothetical protein
MRVALVAVVIFQPGSKLRLGRAAKLMRRMNFRRMRPASDALAGILTSLSADEMVAALKLSAAPAPVRAAVRTAFRGISAPLARALARFDARISGNGVAPAASAALQDLGARWTRVGDAPPVRGALLVVANHPGAYDALALIAALGRDDVALVAAERAFLRAMPSLAGHLIFVPDSPAPPHARARGLRRALTHLAHGGAVIQFGAGCIEPDPAFPLPSGSDGLEPWQAGTAVLVRGAAAVDGRVVIAMVGGVHSARAKSFFLTGLAEARGITTLAPLLQVAVARFRDVDVSVRFGRAVDASTLVRLGSATDITAQLRSQALALWPAWSRA